MRATDLGSLDPLNEFLPSVISAVKVSMVLAPSESTTLTLSKGTFFSAGNSGDVDMVQSGLLKRRVVVLDFEGQEREKQGRRRRKEEEAAERTRDSNPTSGPLPK